jgi:hypothetical protein
MRTKLVGTVLMLAVAAVAVPSASDRVAVYARVDRVVLEPNDVAPATIQVWGVFSLANVSHGSMTDYHPAARGYLYYRVRDNQALVRREWADLKQVAGTGQIVAFGSRWDDAPRLRHAGDTPAAPDVYTINIGLTKISGRTDYAPIHAIIAFKP